jgi:hypothetical protein
LALGVISPLDGGGAPYWPCLTGRSDTDCRSIPAGGWVSGIPYLSLSYSCSGGSCAELTWWFQDGTVDTVDHLIVTISIKQGSRTSFDQGRRTTAPILTRCNSFTFSPRPGSVPGIVQQVSSA